MDWGDAVGHPAVVEGAVGGLFGEVPEEVGAVAVLRDDADEADGALVVHLDGLDAPSGG